MLYDTGTTAFMIIANALVIMMTPALALFYGGLSRKKNTVNTMLMCILCGGIVGCTWTLLGDSFAYGGAAPYDDAGNLVNPLGLFFGGFDRISSGWSVDEVIAANAVGAETLADSAYGSYPSAVSISFQASFAMVTTAIVTGSLAGRCKFGVVAFVAVAWPLLVYAPMAHMVWGGGIIGNENAIAAIDFAGGTAVHICSGLAGLVLALMLGKRQGFEVGASRPHNVPNIMLGAGLLFVGWFGFNGGSALVADGNAGLAVFNSVACSCAGVVAWMVVERMHVGSCTLAGACTGMLAGLVIITPACGFVTPAIAILMGVIGTPVVYFFIAVLKRKLGWDDALDAFGCHGVGGIVGAVLTGLFALPELSWTGVGGLLVTGEVSLLVSQVEAVVFTVAFVGVMTALIGLVAKLFFKGSMRVSPAVESTGLDVRLHGESGYPAFDGLDSY
ncbi:MAG: ammonium transporter [Coriobacteriales bacterium]